MIEYRRIIAGFFAGMLLIPAFGSYTQTGDCKVLMPAVSARYTGKCRNGLAHGKGVAEGIDLYTGEFRAGLAHGKGTYRWAGGVYYEGDWRYGMREGKGRLVTRDSVITGYWRADRYIGETQIPPYKIVRTLHVVRYSFNKVANSKNEIRIKLSRGGVDNAGVEDLSFTYSSGTEFSSGTAYGLENSTFPLEIKLMFNAWNIFRSAKSEVVFEFTINEPASWNVTVNY
ncbi:MAG: hypothetical protein IQL11_07470 [Bacteroidales bacterium]|nr:hypothetical protein [Bacteroidales bacterium]